MTNQLLIDIGLNIAAFTLGAYLFYGRAKVRWRMIGQVEGALQVVMQQEKQEEK